MSDAPRIAEEGWAPSLADVSAALRKAIGVFGEHGSDRWLQLGEIALDLETGSVAELLARLEEMSGVEIRRVLLGVDLPSWQRMVESDVLERAAAGSAEAVDQVLRSVGDWERESLRLLLELTPAQTKRHVLKAVRLFAEQVFAEREAELTVALEREAAGARAKIAASPGERAVLEVTGGYEYLREPEFDRVILFPHFAAPPWLLLMERRDARVIGYPAAPFADDAEKELRERLLRLGRALGDEKRVEILRRLAEEEMTLGELVVSVGLAKSTIHHHLVQLRAAGLIRLRGNARGYWYSLSPEGRDASVRLLGDALG
ncbi:MAG: winged helix-turn-helix transcriptional regulator [Actinobacteria bacterium]|nr:winged helix-turn-helix transcriptional regulator [Actinomycetota bacterium]